MKNALLLLGLCVAFVSCADDDSQATNNPDPIGANPENPANPGGGDNKVLMLRVDNVTGAFEGGKELTFEAANTFTISSDYVSPGDFGSIKLKYDELDATFFDGTIHWMGLGEMSYPESLDGVDAFVTLEEELAMPALSAFHTVEYGSEGEGLQTNEPDHQVIWDAIDDLELVKEYREANPEAKISLFLYTPSVGIGNPEEWDWFVILKN
jgi:hypothetical protein